MPALIDGVNRFFGNTSQIEYMVVSLDDTEKNAKLSLRQTEILAKLSTIVNDICADCPKEYVTSSS